MARNGLHALLVILLGISHAEAFFCAAAGPFRRRGNAAAAAAGQNYCPAATTTCCQGRGVSDSSPRLEGEHVLPPYFQSAATVAWVQLMLDSFEETFDGESLIRGLDRESLCSEEQAREVAVADVAVVSHDFLRSADDPIFIYGASKRMANKDHIRSLVAYHLCRLLKGLSYSVISLAGLGLALRSSTPPTVAPKHRLVGRFVAGRVGVLVHRSFSTQTTQMSAPCIHAKYDEVGGPRERAKAAGGRGGQSSEMKE